MVNLVCSRPNQPQFWPKNLFSYVGSTQSLISLDILHIYLAQKLSLWTGIIFIGVILSVCGQVFILVKGDHHFSCRKPIG